MIIEVLKGEHIAGVAERLVAAARKFGSVTEATFNDVRLVATPDSFAEDICRQYDDECSRQVAERRLSREGRPSADSRDFDAARIRRLEYSNDRLRLELAEQLGAAHAEIDDLRIKVRAAVRVLLEFAGRLGVTDDELADLLAHAEVRTEDSAAANGEGGASS